ncbi:MAG: hypothetical protein JNL47_00040 [Bacteroidia bacterium]|nr:hypothetical protein [Bacteroidia bacterium]
MNNTTLKEELKDTPLLKQLHGANPYAVPDNYFEKLHEKVGNKLEEKPVVIRRISVSRLAARLAAAASVILFIGTAGWFYLQKSGQIQEDIYLTPEQISNSVYFDDLDLTFLKEEAASATDKNETDVIENYLLENDLTFLFE